MQPLGSGYEVLLQGFNWESHKYDNGWYQFLHDKVRRFRDLGVTAIWLPPPSDSVSAEGYLPRKLESLESAYGSSDDLRSLIATFRDAGIAVVVDCVLNHRCADQQDILKANNVESAFVPKSVDGQGKWNIFTGDYSWQSWAICNGNDEFQGTGNGKEGACFEAAPNLDHQNLTVKEDITRWLQWLKSELKVDGWRFDFAKGYSGRHVGEYIRATQPVVAIGEFWDCCEYGEDSLLQNQDPHRQRIIDWIDSTGGTSSAFDFTTKAVLQEALAKGEYWRLKDAKGKPPGVLGWWPAHAVTFLDNHDTGSTQQHWPFPQEHLDKGYVYILTHPGMPCIFIDHILEEHKDGKGASLWPLLCALLAVRRRCGITATSRVEIVEASDSCYAAILDEKLASKLGPGDWQPDKSRGSIWHLELSGGHFAVWSAQ